MPDRSRAKKQKGRPRGGAKPKRKPLVKAPEPDGARGFFLRLYVTGSTPRSVRAIENIKRICEEHLKGQYDLRVVDLYQQPQLAAEQGILAAPTLVKSLPAPLRRLVGDMADEQRVLGGLDLRRAE